MSLLEIDMVPNDNSDIDSTLSTSPTPRRMSSRRSTSMCSLNLHRTNRRVISKPKKNTKSCNPTTENEIRKFYLNQKMTKLKSTLLETIFEDDGEDESNDAADDDDASSQVKLVGNKKIKRCLSFAVGSHPTKTLVQKRRKRIQTVLGGKPKTKRVSMDTFMKKLKAIQDSKAAELNDEGVR